MAQTQDHFNFPLKKKEKGKKKKKTAQVIQCLFGNNLSNFLLKVLQIKDKS